MYQLILCDYSMPDMNGFECLNHIRSLLFDHYSNNNKTNSLEAQKDGKDTEEFMPYLCCLTAYPLKSFTKDMKKTAGLAVQAIVQKPIFREQLREILVKSKI